MPLPASWTPRDATACTIACRCTTPPAAGARPARVLVNGGSVVIREKFSAREFWDDVVRWDCTLFQYIGELCRYLVNSPPHPKETRAPAAARLRQRPAARRLARFQGAIPNPADHRVLRRHRRQRVAVQFRGQGRRGRPHPLVLANAFRPRSCASTSSASSRCATRRVSAGVAGADIGDVVLGNCMGPGGDVARVAALTAGLPVTVPGLTVDRQCGSGLAAIAVAASLVRSQPGVLLAGGTESASTAPWRFWPPAPGQEPQRYQRAPFAPASLGDPEMGLAADLLAERWQVSRARQDAYAARSRTSWPSAPATPAGSTPSWSRSPVYAATNGPARR